MRGRPKALAACAAMLCITAVLLGPGCARKVVLVSYLGAPALAPGTTPEMNTSGFWIDRLEDPDTPVLDAGGITALNARIARQTGAVTEVTRLAGTRSGRLLKGSLERMYASIVAGGYVDSSGAPASKMLDELKVELALDSIPETVSVHWALVVRPTDQRLLPTSDALYRNPADTAIDRLQNNTLDLSTEVAVLHVSSKGAWSYVTGPFSEGWARTADLAACPRDVIERYKAWEPFVVVTSARADLFMDPLLRRRLASVQMGLRLPLLSMPGEGVVQVLVPVRGEDGRCLFEAAYVSGSQVNPGFLVYTPRNALIQAFRLLHTPYGWGGMYGEQDCSRLIQEVFACFGITMPRNSSQQARVGRAVAELDRKTGPRERSALLADKATPGITILQFPGHIMLYVGHVEGVPFAIHDLYAYTEKVEGVERLVALGRVAVTNMELGGGTSKGSFLMRLASIKEVTTW